jgi:MSHA biogenesis protein MshM
MGVAGYARRPMLARAPRRAIYRASRGIPRLVNILSNKALLLVYGEGGERLESRHVYSAALDTPAAVQPRRWWQWTGLRLGRAAK